MRQPLEDGVVVRRPRGGLGDVPCRSCSVAAMNPCPCGQYGDAKRQCQCTPIQMQRLPQQDFGAAAGPQSTSTSKCRRWNTRSWRPLQKGRVFRGDPGSGRGGARRCSGSGSPKPKARTPSTATRTCAPKDVHKHCVLDDAAQGLLKAAMADLHLSARAYDRILKVARTIADLAGAADVAADHVAEAIQYRSLDRQYWA